MSSKLVYPDRLQFRVPADVRQAIEREAAKARCGEGELCRRVILAGLDHMGVALPPVLAEG